METAHIREFLVLIDHTSCSSAARALYVSQPTLSRHISMLEGELGVRLLNRSKQGISLTESGKVAVASFDAMVKHYEGLVRTIGDGATKV